MCYHTTREGSISVCVYSSMFGVCGELTVAQIKTRSFGMFSHVVWYWGGGVCVSPTGASEESSGRLY